MTIYCMSSKIVLLYYIERLHYYGMTEYGMQHSVLSCTQSRKSRAPKVIGASLPRDYVRPSTQPATT